MSEPAILCEDHLRDVEIVWDFHYLSDRPRYTDVAVVFGSWDPSVATHAAELYHAGWFPVMVFSGSASDATVEVFRQGEAVAYRAMAAAAGVPDEAMLLEPEASNSGANIQLSRRVLAAAGVVPTTVTLIAMPYMQRCAYATCRR